MGRLSILGLNRSLHLITAIKALTVVPRPTHQLKDITETNLRTKATLVANKAALSSNNLRELINRSANLSTTLQKVRHQ